MTGRLTCPDDPPMRFRLAVLLALLAAAPATASTSINYGPISHKGLKNAGPAPTGLKLNLQLGFVANQSGISNAVKAASDPTSSSYGKYLSMSTLQSKYGASSSKRNGVINAFKKVGSTAKVDVTHLRALVTISVKNVQKLFGVKWDLYATGQPNEYVALPVSTPKAPSGIKGNVDTIAGVRLDVTQRGSRAVDGGTPTRTGTIAAGCASSEFPQAVASSQGLFPNQILTAYGIDTLQAAGLRGQGSYVAIVGEAPTPAADVNTYRDCFGFQGTSLSIHNAGSIQPILESSLDAMTVSMVAPNLSAFDLWVHPINESDDDGDALGFLQLLAQPLQATANGAHLPDVISVSYGVCEATVKPYSASRTVVERQLMATAALGITTVVAAGDTGSSACAKTSTNTAQSASWPATSPWVLAVGGTNVTLTPANSIASSGVWNDTAYAFPFTESAGGGGGVSTINKRPWWQPATASQSTYRMVPDVAAFADPTPGYAIVCSPSVQGCGPSSGQTITFVGGTSAATPLVAGMIALWDQQARSSGLPRPGFVPPLLYSLRNSPGALLDITEGNNMVFPGVACCTAGPGFDLASGLGSPMAAAIASLLAH
jgi:subtilase family serine protease